MEKRILSLVLALALCCELAIPVRAVSGGFDIRNGVLTKYTGSDRNITIPDSVTKIAAYAFYECANIESVSIPNSVTAIEEYAFWKCSNLKKVSFPKSDALTRNLENVSFYDIFRGDAALEEITNCPNEVILQSIAANQAVLDGWINPGEYVEAQSERVTRLSNQICAGKLNDYEKAKAIFDWVTANIGYDYEYFYNRKSEVATSVEGVLDSKLSVCAGYSRVTQALLQAQRIPAIVVSGFADGARGWPTDGRTNHDWNMAFIDERWVYLDTTWGRPGKQNDKTGELVDDGTSFNLSWFDPSMLYLSLSHKPESTSLTSEKDIPSDWAKEGIWEAICAGLVPNEIQGAYQSNITRKDFCQLMVKLVEQVEARPISAYLASKGLSAPNPFTDTSDAAVRAAYALGIVSGTSATTFNPDGSITRQSAAAMLSRTAKLLGLTSGSGETFSDITQISDGMREGIAFISGVTDPTTGSKVMSGTGDGKFSPAATFTRQQAIITVLRLFHCVK